MAKPLGLEVKANLNDMQIGDCIPCRYTATSGAAGTFSELGTCTASEIPTAGTAAPNGLLYFIKVDKGTLIADRIVQNNISWDTLNAAKYIEGIGFYQNIIPSMTSETRPSGKVLYSQAAQVAKNNWGAFDGSTSTDVNSWAIDSTSGYIGYQFPTAKIIRSYGVFAQSAPSQTNGNLPKNWTFEGSNDNTDWIILDTKINQRFAIGERKYFDIVNNSEYTSYRLNISLPNGSYIRVAELEMYYNSIYIRSLSGGCAYADSNGNSSLTDKSLGAWPVNNEWDKYIVNSDLDGKINKGDNNIWHWSSAIYNWCKETELDGIPGVNNTYRTMRGRASVNNLYVGSFATSSTANALTGFRPVLNYIESDIASEVIY